MAVGWLQGGPCGCSFGPRLAVAHEPGSRAHMQTEVKPALPISKPTGFKASAVMRSAVAAASEDAELATGWTTVRKVVRWRRGFGFLGRCSCFNEFKQYI